MSVQRGLERNSRGFTVTNTTTPQQRVSQKLFVSKLLLDPVQKSLVERCGADDTRRVMRCQHSATRCGIISRSGVRQGRRWVSRILRGQQWVHACGESAGEYARELLGEYRGDNSEHVAGAVMGKCVGELVDEYRRDGSESMARAALGVRVKRLVGGFTADGNDVVMIGLRH